MEPNEVSKIKKLCKTSANCCVRNLQIIENIFSMNVGKN